MRSSYSNLTSNVQWSSDSLGRFQNKKQHTEVKADFFSSLRPADENYPTAAVIRNEIAATCRRLRVRHMSWSRGVHTRLSICALISSWPWPLQVDHLGNVLTNLNVESRQGIIPS